MTGSYQHIRAGLHAAALSLILIVWGTAIWLGNSALEAARTEASQLVQQTTQAFATTAKLSFEVADQALQRLQYTATYARPEDFSREAQLLSDPHWGNTLNRASWIGADGIMRANFQKGEPAPLLDVRDRSYFQTFAENPTNRIFVSEPIQGKASRQWIILFARPLIKDKQFHGVVFVGFEASAINTLLAGVAHPHIMTTLLSPGNRIIGRSTEAEQHVGKPIDLRPYAAQLGQLFEAPSPVDGKPRLYSARRVADWGMQVFSGYDVEAISEAAYEARRNAYVAALVITLAVALAYYFALQTLAGREKAHHDHLRQSQRSQQILDGMMEGVAVLDALGTIQFVNPALRSLLGEHVGEPFTRVIQQVGLTLVAEDGKAPPVDNPIQTLCLEGGETIQGLWLTDDSQPSRWIQFTATPLADDTPGANGAIISLNDHTEEYQRLSELAITQTIVNQMGDGVVVTDAERRIIRTNPAARRMSGYENHELEGLTDDLLYADRHDQYLRAEITQTLERGDTWFGRIWIRRADGKEFCSSQSISPIRDAHGKIIRHVAVWRDITQQEVQEQQLWRRANFDPLTHLANRQRFEDRLSHTLTQAERHHTHFAVCMLDLDYFKKVNDQLGHAAGDAVLRECAQRMLNLVREGDTLARIGGDEFALIAPDVQVPDDALALVEKLVRAVASPFLLTEGEARISLSVGIATYPRHGRTATALLNAADRAVYEAKGQGRNGYVMATLPGTEEAASSKISPTS